MTADFFYDEWGRRRPGDRRDLARAGRLLGLLAPPPLPTLTVVGSKGKGTAATYASALLAAAGCRVVTVTSPGLRHDTDRIRVDGVAVSGRDLAALGRRLSDAARTLPPPGAGYLSPSALFTLAGLSVALDAGPDGAVLEAGMGGASDEVGLVPPTVVAITTVFGGHLDVLGDTPAEIAADKAGVVAELTRAVVSLPQTPDVAAAIDATVAGRTGRRAEVITDTAPEGASALREPAPLAGFPAPAMRSGLHRPNALLGCAAARRLLEATGRPAPDPARAAGVLASVRLPGRLSWHTIPGATVLLDSAVEADGAAAALAEAYRRWDRVDHVLVCLPDHKDLEGVLSALGGLPVTTVRMPDRESLRFTRTRDGLDIADLTPGRLAAFGERIVVLGTVYFTGRVLDLLDADTTRLFAG
ncbi:hypothetical protein [Actinoallomurus acaciae]|uniref:Dihydrofolate synthase/folylpolyglutamate synthase n=1 Tax=Actinoallomurus acaciae TaxID=502577 RepID=A0ABV5YUK6_9ACTN